jgi:glycosyltransferase involved in cell wall biosynthesis
MLHVLQLHPSGLIGGTELMVVRLAERLNADGVSTEVATLDRPGEIAAMLRARGIPVYSLGGRGFPAAAVSLARFLRSRDYDVINVYGFKASMLVRLLRRPLRLRASVVCGVQGLHVTEVENMDSIKSRFASACERHSAFLIDHYESNSLGAMEFLAGCGIDRSKISYIPMGIDTEAWPLRAVGALQDPPTILCIARFVPRKRQQDLILALALLRARGVKFRAVLAGDGPTLPAIRRLVAEQELADVIVLPGNLGPEAIRHTLGAATASVLCSTWEGMPTAVLEAMATGVPVVATDVNGTADLVVDGKTGRRVPVGAPGPLAAALMDVLSNTAAAHSRAAAARRLVEERYSLDAMVDGKKALYEACARAL